MAGFEHYGKKYKLYSNDNWEEYLKALGSMNVVQRKLLVNTVLTVCVTVKGDKHSMLVTSVIKNKEYIFNLGEWYEDTLEDGRKCQMKFTMEGNVMTHEATMEGKQIHITRTFTDQEMVAVLRFGDVLSTRKFKRVE